MSVAAIPSPEEVAPALEPRPGVDARPVVSEPVDREAQLEARIRQLESMVGQLSTQVQQLTKRSTTTSAVGGNTSPERAVAGGTTTRGTAPLDVGNAATADRAVAFRWRGSTRSIVAPESLPLVPVQLSGHAR